MSLSRLDEKKRRRKKNSPSFPLASLLPLNLRHPLVEARDPARALPHRELGDRPGKLWILFLVFSLVDDDEEKNKRKRNRKTHFSLFLPSSIKTKIKSWDIVARYGRDPTVSRHLPRAFFDDFVRVADDEGKHFLALRDRLEALGSRYGAFAAHDALWHSAAETAHSLPARLAVEHAVHEARGLDVMPMTLEKMRLDPESQALLRVS